jgi:hypothetical protein
MLFLSVFAWTLAMRVDFLAECTQHGDFGGYGKYWSGGIDIDLLFQCVTLSLAGAACVPGCFAEYNGERPTTTLYLRMHWRVSYLYSNGLSRARHVWKNQYFTFKASADYLQRLRGKGFVPQISDWKIACAIYPFFLPLFKRRLGDFLKRPQRIRRMGHT